MNWILTAMALTALVFGLLGRRMGEISAAALTGCGQAIPLVLSLAGAICLWSGLMEVARQSSMAEKLAKLLRPFFSRLFPKAGRDPETLSQITLNAAANLLGLGNAATPAGLAAIRRMKGSGASATQEMITLVVMNCCSLQLIPSSTAALRAAAGSKGPMEILPAVLLSSALSLAVSLGLVFFCARIFPGKEREA